MKIELITFGRIAELIRNQQIDIAGVADTDALKQHLEQQFPALKDIKYKLALNKTMVQANHKINDSDTVAIMPPFSGG